MAGFVVMKWSPSHFSEGQHAAQTDESRYDFLLHGVWCVFRNPKYSSYRPDSAILAAQKATRSLGELSRQFCLPSCFRIASGGSVVATGAKYTPFKALIFNV